MVAASNRHLEDEVAKGHFRSDLFNPAERPSRSPPLRARPEDIPPLVEHFIDVFNAEFSKKVLGASPTVYAVLQRYRWPGNVRELRNVVERAMLLTGGDRLEAHDFASVDMAMPPASRSNCWPRWSRLGRPRTQLRAAGAQALRLESNPRVGAARGQSLIRFAIASRNSASASPHDHARHRTTRPAGAGCHRSG